MVQEKYHHNNLKAELIEKRLKLLDEEGYVKFSLKKVAKACNVSQTVLYRHFKNKDKLRFAIGNEAMNKFAQSLQSAVDQYPDAPKRQLREMGCSYIRFFTENPEYLRLIFLGDIDKRMKIGCNTPEGYKPFTNNENVHSFQILYKAVERYKKEVHTGTSGSMDQSTLLLYCWGLVHGISIIIARGEFTYQRDIWSLSGKYFGMRLS